MNTLSVVRMFQNMFRKRGRPPEQLPIGGYDNSGQRNQSEAIPVHQSLVPPRRTETLVIATWKEI